MAVQVTASSATRCPGIFILQTRRLPCCAAHKVTLNTVNLGVPINFPLTQNENIHMLFWTTLGPFHCQGLAGFEPRLPQPHTWEQQV